MNKKILSGTGLLIIAAIVLAANLIGAMLFQRAKIDMTQEKLFTLSKGSQKIIGNIEEPIRAELYYSKTAMSDVPPLKIYGDRVYDMLREYQGLSKGKMTLEVLDPRPDTEIEESAQKYGLQGVPVQQGGDRLFLGLVLKSERGTEERIPFFNPQKEDTLEYDITKAIYNINNPQRKKIAIASGLPVMGSAPQNMMMQQQQQPQKPWAFVRELKNNFDVTEIEPSSTEIPKDINLLIIVHPKNFPAALNYAIDQYVMGGGRVVAFVDPYCEADQAQSPNADMQSRMQASYNSDMPELFKSWGVELVRDVPNSKDKDNMGFGGGAAIVADPSLAAKVRTPDGQTMDMIVWLQMSAKNRNDSEIITSQLDSLMVASGGELRKNTDSKDITLTPLIYTSDAANLISDMPMKFGGMPDQLASTFKPGTSRLNLAYKISGKFKTAFPDGKPSAAPTPGPEEGRASIKPGPPVPDPNQIKESKQPTTIIVVGDVDMISDRYSVNVSNFFGQEIASALNDNLAFISNASENLTGSEDLIALRSRGRSQRPFTRVNEIEKKAQEQYREQAKELQKKLDDANKRINEMQQGTEGTDQKRIVDQAFMKELAKFREDQASTAKQLREVKRHLRENVEKLQARVMFTNIALIPLVVTILSIGIAFFKSRRRRVAQ